MAHVGTAFLTHDSDIFFEIFLAFSHFRILCLISFIPFDFMYMHGSATHHRSGVQAGWTGGMARRDIPVCRARGLGFASAAIAYHIRSVLFLVFISLYLLISTANFSSRTYLSTFLNILLLHFLDMF
ncbi:hypothetical protein GGR58DRAFT_397503 [Xylaria digitata]|nr:hypothetical protein GGR58DRAFT_397503 [Xylaria digitata]